LGVDTSGTFVVTFLTGLVNGVLTIWTWTIWGWVNSFVGTNGTLS
jgi:hypothetical protein